MTPAAEGASNSTHKALRIAEILRNVYKMLAEQNKRGTLASMARVCHAFTEPALDMIWEHIVGLEPFALVIEFCIGCSTKLQLTKGAFERFDLYASRVREFTQNDNDFDRLLLDLLAHIYNHCVPRPIFPNLRKLNALYFDEHTSPRLPESIITPSLRYIHVVIEDDRYLEHEAQLVCKTLSALTRPDGTANNQGSQLRYFVFYAIVDSAHLDQLMSLHQLRVLHIDGITPEHIGGIDYLKRLSTLLHLQDMSLTLQENEFFHPLPHDGFPSLERLFIQGDAPTVQYFLSALPPSRLKYLNIMDRVHVWASTVVGAGQVRACMEGWHDCFCALVRQAATLITLRITLSSDTAKPGDVEECGRDLPVLSVIEPLLELQQLKKVQLEGFMKMPFFDAALGSIVAAWRQIEYLDFPTPFAEVQQPCLTSLKLLTLFCPNLTYLSMGFDTKSPASDTEAAQNLHALPLAVCHPLRTLDLCETDLRREDVPWLATQLTDWFPMLKLVTAVHSKDVAAAVTATLLEFERKRNASRSAGIRRLSLTFQKPAKTCRERSSSL